MSNKKNSPKSEENILTTSATASDLDGMNVPKINDDTASMMKAMQEAIDEAEAAKEAEEAAKAAKIDEALKTVDTIEKKQAAEARAKAAKAEAREAHVKQYEGNAKAFLLARRVDQVGKSLVYRDFSYSFVDEAGMNVPEDGKCDVTEVFTKKAAKAYREAALNIARQVVPFHGAEEGEAKAAERAKVAEDFKLMFEYLGVTCADGWEKSRKPDMNAIFDKAFDVNFSGDYDGVKAKVLEGMWSISRRILKGREAASNAFAAREAEAKRKAEAAKTEGK